MKASLSSFPTIAAFVIAKNTLDEAKSLSAKLQKRDQDIYEAYKMVSEVIENLTKLRKNVDASFTLWYNDINELADKIGAPESTPRKKPSKE